MQAPCRKKAMQNQAIGGAAAAWAAEFAQGWESMTSRENKKAPPEGMGRAQGSAAEAFDLGGAAPRTPLNFVPMTIGCRTTTHKRSMGNAAMQIRGACRPGQKKRLQPKLEPYDRAEAKSKVMAQRKGGGYAPNRVTQAEGGGYGPDRCRKKRVRGRRIRSGFTSDTCNIDFDRMVSNAPADMSAMHSAQRQVVNLSGARAGSDAEGVVGGDQLSWTFGA